MNILKSPAEYASLLKFNYPKSCHVQAVFEAAQAHTEIPPSYWVEVLAIMQR